MPACVRKRDEKWRVVECRSGKLVRNKAGTPVDGGGHQTQDGARKQAVAINRSQGYWR